MGGFYESGDGELEPNKKRALNVLEFVRDIVASNTATLCGGGGAAKGLRYSPFTLNVLAAFTAAGGAAVGRVQQLNLGGPVASTLKRRMRLLMVEFDPLNPEANFEAYAEFCSEQLAEYAGDDVSLRHVYFELVCCCHFMFAKAVYALCFQRCVCFGAPWLQAGRRDGGNELIVLLTGYFRWCRFCA